MNVKINCSSAIYKHTHEIASFASEAAADQIEYIEIAKII